MLSAARGLLWDQLGVRRALRAVQDSLVREAAAAEPPTRRRFAACAGADVPPPPLPTAPTPGPDLAHRSATELVWPASRQQLKFAARVQRALVEVLRREEALTHREGVALKAVRASPDLGTAFVLWDSVTGRGREAEAALARRAPGLRAAVARALGARRAPRLEWRRDAPSAEDDALGLAYAAMGAERAAAAAEGGAADVVDSADAAEAALGRLRER